MFKSQQILIQLKHNSVKVTNLRTREAVTQSAIRPFSTNRIIVSNFSAAEETVIQAIKSLGLLSSFSRKKIAIQQTEEAEGGLSDIEKRALRDLAEQVGATKVYLVDSFVPISIDEAIGLID